MSRGHHRGVGEGHLGEPEGHAAIVGYRRKGLLDNVTETSYRSVCHGRLSAGPRYDAMSRDVAQWLKDATRYSLFRVLLVECVLYSDCLVRGSGLRLNMVYGGNVGKEQLAQ